MDDRTRAILAKLQTDLDWRGPGGKGQGVLTLQRDDAAHLVEWCRVSAAGPKQESESADAYSRQHPCPYRVYCRKGVRECTCAAMGQ